MNDFTDGFPTDNNVNSSESKNSDYLYDNIYPSSNGKKILFAVNSKQLSVKIEPDDSNEPDNLNTIIGKNENDSLFIKNYFYNNFSKGLDYSYKLEPKVYQYPLTQIEIQHITTKGYLVYPEKLIYNLDNGYDAEGNRDLTEDTTFKKDNFKLPTFMSMVPEVQKFYTNFNHGDYLGKINQGQGLYIKNNYTMPYTNPQWFSSASNANILSGSSSSKTYNSSISQVAMQLNQEDTMLNELGVNLPNFDLGQRDQRKQVGGELISDWSLSSNEEKTDSLRLKLNIKSAKIADKKKYAFIFHKYGYNLNSMVNRDLILNGRKYFNFVKINNLDDYVVNNYLNNEEFNAIRDAFKEGIRFWHQYEVDEMGSMDSYNILNQNNKLNIKVYDKDNYEDK